MLDETIRIIFKLAGIFSWLAAIIWILSFLKRRSIRKRKAEADAYKFYQAAQQRFYDRLNAQMWAEQQVKTKDTPTVDPIQRKLNRLLALAARPGTVSEGQVALKIADKLAKKHNIT